jgi:hypothetical protein
MLILEMLFNEKLIEAESDLNKADRDNIVELCRRYLHVLTEYREDLYKLRGSARINLQQSSLLARELVEQIRKAIRSTVEITTMKRNQTEQLLESFTSICGYEAVATFNQLKYKGLNDWELKSNSINSLNEAGFEQIALQDAIETAGFLRREAYINDKTTFFRNVIRGEQADSIG